MLSVLRSEIITEHEKYVAPIILIYQFFIHENPERRMEILECLKFNVLNVDIHKIILLNEKIYSEKELGIKSSKILQIDIGRRMKFSDVFHTVERLNLDGYIITCNADIFFDDTIINLYKCGLHKERYAFAQNRFEYDNVELIKCKINMRADSQDTWIFHSNFNIKKKQRSVFNVNYGVGGCDNKILYLLKILGFNIKCVPYFLKTFHNHKSDIRSWNSKALVPRPYMNIIPHVEPRTEKEVRPLDEYANWAGSTYSKITNNESIFLFEKDKYNFDVNLKNLLDNNIPFLILQTDEYINTVSYLVNILKKNTQNREIITKYLQFYLQNFKKDGIVLDNMGKIRFFSDKYIQLIQKSHISLHNAPWNYGKRLWNNRSIKEQRSQIAIRSFEQKSDVYILNKTKKSKMVISEKNVFNIGDYIAWSNIWCEHIQDKKILIISKHHELIKEQIDKNVDFYRKPIFKNCKYTYVTVPTATNEIDFVENINIYVSKLQLDGIDLVFIGDTLYYFLIAEYLNLQKKAVISMGTRLPLLYGLYNKQDIDNNKDIITLYMTKDWKNF